MISEMGKREMSTVLIWDPDFFLMAFALITFLKQLHIHERYFAQPVTPKPVSISRL